MTVVASIARIVLVGVGATAVIDAWLTLLKRLGIPTLNFAFIGRWVGHLFRSTFAHHSIGQAPSIPGELALGWLTHYAVGVVFAGLLVCLYGVTWTQAPSVLSALAVGLCTVAFHLFVMQPTMGMGIAASRTPVPLKNCMRSMTNHMVFALGI